MLDLSGKGPKHKPPARGKGDLPFLSYLLPTPQALVILAVILFLLVLLYLFSL